MRVRHLKAWALAAMLVQPTACAAPTSYFGIDLRPPSLTTEQTIERQAAVRERNLFMLIAALKGCYTREEGGFGPVRVLEAPSFECARMLSTIERQSAELGLGRAPGGIWALNLQTLASQAQAGNKNAQLELGIRFADGIGLPKNQKNACKLYSSAAAQSGGKIWIYVPPVGNGTSGRVMPVDTGPAIPDLAEARERLVSEDC